MQIEEIKKCFSSKILAKFEQKSFNKLNFALRLGKFGLKKIIIFLHYLFASGFEQKFPDVIFFGIRGELFICTFEKYRTSMLFQTLLRQTTVDRKFCSVGGFNFKTGVLTSTVCRGSGYPLPLSPNKVSPPYDLNIMKDRPLKK